jgi:hypothetical protein
MSDAELDLQEIQELDACYATAGNLSTLDDEESQEYFNHYIAGDK